MQGSAGVTVPSGDSPEPGKHQQQQEKQGELFQQHIPVWEWLTPVLPVIAGLFRAPARPACQNHFVQGR